MMGMSACNRYSPSWEEDADGTKQESLQSVLGIPDIIGTEIDNAALLRSVTDSYCMVSDENKDQSALLQKAIDDMAGQGGGNLLIPAGTYCFAEVYMKSGVHILVHKDAVLKPYWGEKTKNVIMLYFTSKNDSENSFIHDCSISGLNGEQYTVDYSHFTPDPGDDFPPTMPVRFALCRMVKNFKIADAHILDHYTKYCGIIFVGADAEDVHSWHISRPTNGLINNCTIENASQGYGLCQLHAARNILFRDLKAKGGVTLRLESHAGNNVGVYDIYGYNIHNEYGRAAVLFSPHTSHNGKVLVENVTALSSASAVDIRSGFIDKDSQNNPYAEIGTYSSDSKVHNVACKYGKEAQIEAKDVWIYEPDMYQYILRIQKDEAYSQVEGPSFAPVLDSTGDYLEVSISELKSEGYPYHENKILYKEDFKRNPKDTWKIAEGIPAFQK